jgi:hypothetical protein
MKKYKAGKVAIKEISKNLSSTKHSKKINRLSRRTVSIFIDMWRDIWFHAYGFCDLQKL